MNIKKIIKRDNTIELFDEVKIVKAIHSAMIEARNGEKSDAKLIKNKVINKLNYKSLGTAEFIPTVENIQDIIEKELMAPPFQDVAKVFILYRDKRNRDRKNNIFKKRVILKPYEYPKLAEYVNAIRHSFWVHTEFNYTSDIQDYKSELTEVEKSAVKNTMLAISQIEVSVKTFWGDIYKKMPKPEIGAVGATFAESEVRHHDAYSHLLDVLGLNEDFKNLNRNPTIISRVNYLEDILKNATAENNKEYSKSIVLFSLFVEHVSLFSQFLIIMAFNKYKNVLKGISNVVEATSKEEQIHGDFGIDLIKTIKEENPYWFNKDYNFSIIKTCKEAYLSESKIIDWIFEKGELEFLPKNIIKDFIKDRFNKSLQSIGISKIFEVNQTSLADVEWFNDEIFGTKHGDFFVKRSINYSKRIKSITKEDLF